MVHMEYWPTMIMYTLQIKVIFALLYFKSVASLIVSSVLDNFNDPTMLQ